MATAILRAKCTKCDARLRIRPDFVGQVVRCTQCRSVFRVQPRQPSSEFAPSDAAEAFSDMSIPTVAPQASNVRPIWIMAGTAAFGLLFVGVAMFVNRDRLFVVSELAAASTVKQVAVAAKIEPPPIAAPPVKVVEQFPRRMLAISVNQYLYANPISFGSAKRNVGVLLDRMADKYKFPKDQLYLVTDGRTNRTAEPPIKPVIQSAVEQFLASSRAQDRIVLLFAGHATVIEDKAYLVPLEGELNNATTLLELDWLYSKLAACKARQKVLIVDVCRFDGGRGTERTVAGAMDPILEAALKKPPDGVQVWSACSAKEFSHESKYQAYAGNEVEGGLFLGQFLNAFLRHGTPQAKPNDSIPIDSLAAKVNSLTTEMARGALKETQTPFLVGSENKEGAAYDPAEPIPAKLVFSKAAQTGTADPKFIKQLVDEIKLPPIKAVAVDESAVEDMSSVMPFSAAAMRGYEADYASTTELLDQPDKYPVRVAVLKAVEILDRHGRGEVRLGTKTKNVGVLRQTISLPIDENRKRSIEKEQREGPAAMLVELEEALSNVEKLQSRRDEEKSKRWRAHYDFVLAVMKSRFAYVNEHNLMLGKIRKDELPPLDSKLHNGWRLASQEKLASPRDVKDKADDAKKLLAQIIKENPGTPWEVLARRERLTTLGLAWQPASVKK